VRRKQSPNQSNSLQKRKQNKRLSKALQFWKVKLLARESWRRRFRQFRQFRQLKL
jgi:hypothetical protein